MAAPGEREAAAFKARVAQRVGRLADMVEAVNVLAEQHQDLTDVESSLLWEAYRKRFLQNFAPLRAMANVLDEEDANYYCDFLLSYNDQVRAEVAYACHEALGVLEEHLLPYALHPENVVLYQSIWVLGMIVDEAEEFLDKALEAYETAYKVASESLAPGHQQRLCVLVNLSAFHYDMMKNVNRAFALANAGLAESATIAVTKEAAAIVMQLQDNLAKWMAEQEGDPAAPQTENEGVEAQEDGEEEEPVVDEAESGQLTYKTPYSSSPPSPLVVRSVSPVDRTDFLGPNAWGSDASEMTGEKVIRHRQKAAQARRGMLG